MEVKALCMGYLRVLWEVVTQVNANVLVPVLLKHIVEEWDGFDTCFKTLILLFTRKNSRGVQIPCKVSVESPGRLERGTQRELWAYGGGQGWVWGFGV